MRTPPPRLDSNESRVLGVLIEKALSTPGQYPLSLNALATGCNQKSNRNPELSLMDRDVEDALQTLRTKELVSLVHLSGSRVDRYRHTARATLEAESASLTILAELMLRGPQTAGELRTRTSRMLPIESLDAVRSLVRSLEEDGYVQCLAAAPGTRAQRFVQLLCPGLHPVESTSRSETTGASTCGSPASSRLAERVEALEAEVTTLRAAVARLTAATGYSLEQPEDPLPATSVVGVGDPTVG